VKIESLAAIITTLLVVIIIIAPFLALGAQLLREAQALYRELDLSTTNIAFQLGAISRDLGFPLSSTALNIPSYVRETTSWVLQNFGSIFSSAAQAFLNILLSLLGLYYLLKDGPRLKAYLTSLSPLDLEYDQKIFDRLHKAVSSVVKGSLGIAMLQGLVTGLGFLLFGVPHAVLWGTFAVITALVPNAGTALVIAPAALYLFVTGHGVAALGLLLWGTLAVGLIDNLLGPKFIQRGGLPLHPFIILLSVLGAIALFGPIGFLIGPLTVTLLLTLLELHQAILLKKPR